jgi:hypothetical protein
MGIFNYIDTFFFISLGITFVLILLLVFHFKQRITSLEQKHDTMFEIVTNIVKQIRNMQTNIQHLGEPKTFITTAPPFILPSPPVFQPTLDVVEEIPAKNDESSSSESESDEKEDSDTESESDEKEDSDTESESDDESESESESDEKKSITITPEQGTIAITPEQGTIAITPEQGTIAEPEKVVDVLEPEEDSIIIHKSDGSITALDESLQSTLKDKYKKMTLAALKIAVMEKGLVTDSSRMKKPELLKLLEAESE